MHPINSVETDIDHKYYAKVLRVVDGDNFIAQISLLPAQVGNVYWEVSVRLARCNAREVSEPGGKEASLNLTHVFLQSHAIKRNNNHVPDEYVILYNLVADAYKNRIRAEVTLPNGENLINLLYSNWWVEFWDGKVQPRPIPPWPRPDQLRGITGNEPGYRVE